MLRALQRSTRSGAAMAHGRRALSSEVTGILKRLQLETDAPNHGVFDGTWRGSGDLQVSTIKATGETLGLVSTATPQEVDYALVRAREAYEYLRNVPAPTRGTVLRHLRDALEANLEDLGKLVSLEMGKILPEGIGEVQESVDVCEYAQGLSRSMSGAIRPSERAGHALMEVANPLGVVGVISAFNFPAAVYTWNFALSFICGNATVWAPSATTPLSAIAQTKIIADVFARSGIPPACAALVCGGREVGKQLVASPQVDLMSFTGSEAAGKAVSQVVAARFGKVLLELGGNNAIVVMPDANIELALKNVVFGAIGTAGQRCTSTRRLLVHESIAEDFCGRLMRAYEQLVPTRIGNPLDTGVLCGPLHSADGLDAFHGTIAAAKRQGGRVLFGGDQFEPEAKNLAAGIWATPTIIQFDANARPEVMQEECFAPILFVQSFGTLDEAIRINNSVRQGLSSSIFTNDLTNVHQWIGPNGSDCGIVNVNASTSGAEIGNPFGGNKSTGHGRESGGDSWKQYMRWSSVCLNYSGDGELAQGIVRLCSPTR